VTSHLVLAPPLEQQLIALCNSEGLVNAWQGWFPPGGKESLQVKVKADTRSYLLAQVFLRPSIKLLAGYEGELSLQSDHLELVEQLDAPTGPEFQDIPLLLSYCKASSSRLGPRKVFELLRVYSAAHEEVVHEWGKVPDTNGAGQPIFLENFIASAVLRKPPLSYSARQLAAFERFREARAAASMVEDCLNDLSRIWASRSETDAIAVHPRLHRTYRDIQTVRDFEDGVSETDIFFLSVNALRTLPVGRTLRETLELSASPEGSALRARVGELNAEYRSISGMAVSRLLSRIEKDADRYRALTSRLQSPNRLFGIPDIVLDAAGLVPAIGTVTNFVSLAKSTFATGSQLKANKDLKGMLWASYKGRAE
jgi:hypothetical protein